MIRLITMRSFCVTKTAGRRVVTGVMSYHTHNVAAAATGAQKRALQQHQISPSTKVPLGGGAAAASASVSSNSGSTGSNNLMMGAAVAAGAVGAGYYYYYTTTSTSTDASDATNAVTDANANATVTTQKEDATDDSNVAESTVKDIPVIPSTPSSDETKDTSNNRVTTIQVPSKMKNIHPAPVVVEDHPPQGNRVVTIVSPPPVSSPATSSSSSPSTTSTAAMESLIASHSSVWGSSNRQQQEQPPSPQSTMEQLQQRIGQLQMELQDRTKWEAIRLKEFLIMKEREVTDQYIELMQKQRLEFEDLMAKKLREQEHVLSQQLFQAIQEKEATIQNVLSTALATQKQEYEEEKRVWEEMTSMNIQAKLEDQYLQQLEEYKSQMAQALQEKARQMQSLADKLHQLQTALDASQTSKEGSLKAHRISAAALALTEKLESHFSAKTELETLKVAAGNVGVIATACATLPPSVASTGVPTLSELQTRFMNSVQPKCRQAAFVPKGRVGLEGQLAGMLFATVRYAPSFDDAAPERDSDSAEYVLVRATRNVQMGELEMAVDELDKLSGQAAFVLADWKKNAIDRINVEKALKVIKMECALLNESCLE